MNFIAILSFSAFLAACGSSSSETEKDAGSQQAQSEEQSVIVHFEYGNSDWAPFFEFEKTLEASIAAASVGEYDGNELAVDGSDGTLFMYGPNADKLFELIKPQLATSKLLKNVEVTLRYGAADDPSARESQVRLGE